MSQQIWPLELPLLDFGGQYLTIGDSFQGTQVFGAVGSGKTSAVLRAYASSFLRNQYGLLVLMTKEDLEELQFWEELVHETNREEDLIVFSSTSGHQFNFLDYAYKTTPKNISATENLVNILASVASIAGNNSKGGNDPYWNNSLRDLLRNLIDLALISKESVSLKTLYQILSSSPRLDILPDDDWAKNSLCDQLIKEAEQKKNLSKMQQNDLKLVTQFFWQSFYSLSANTRSIVESCFTTLISPFLRGTLQEIFCSGTNIYPEDVFDKGKIILLNFPIKTYGAIGQTIQIIFKFLFQQAIERRSKEIPEEIRPAALIIDEAHNFVHPVDELFNTSCRSARCAPMYLSQSYSNYTTAFHDRDRAEAFLNPVNTKIFCMNGCRSTNSYASQIFAKRYKYQMGFSSGGGDSEKGGHNTRTNVSQNQVLKDEVLPYDFTVLRSGGARHNRMVDCIAFVGGRDWGDKNHIRLTFQQPKKAANIYLKANHLQ